MSIPHRIYSNWKKEFQCPECKSTKGGLFLYGPYGTGKTHLAVAIAREIILQALGQERLTVLVPLAGADGQATPLEIHVFHAQLQTLLKPEAPAVDDPCHKTARSFHLVEDPENLLSGAELMKAANPAMVKGNSVLGKFLVSDEEVPKILE